MLFLWHACEFPNLDAILAMGMIAILERIHAYHIHYIMLYYTILYYTILYYTILGYTMLFSSILFYIVLFYTILYHTINSKKRSVLAGNPGFRLMQQLRNQRHLVHLRSRHNTSELSYNIILYYII